VDLSHGFSVFPDEHRLRITYFGKLLIDRYLTVNSEKQD